MTRQCAKRRTRVISPPHAAVLNRTTSVLQSGIVRCSISTKLSTRQLPPKIIPDIRAHRSCSSDLALIGWNRNPGNASPSPLNVSAVGSPLSTETNSSTKGSRLRPITSEAAATPMPPRSLSVTGHGAATRNKTKDIAVNANDIHATRRVTQIRIGSDFIKIYFRLKYPSCARSMMSRALGRSPAFSTHRRLKLERRGLVGYFPWLATVFRE